VPIAWRDLIDAKRASVEARSSLGHRASLPLTPAHRAAPMSRRN